ncbi:MAG: hypothetical protein IKE38_03705 [Erysipelotrichaceae bacterium]|nr:hypothetical protein [Erysipelotrichaceae bacterium]
MTLNEYIEKIKLEHNIKYSTQAIENYVTDKARELLKSRSGAVDDETVKAWILEFDPKKEDEEKEEKATKKEDKKDFDKPIGNPKQEKGQWGEQQSLF